MKLFRTLIALLISGWAISACFNPPEYAIEPEISFVDVYFIDVKDTPGQGAAADSIVLKIRFKDGDGDLGIGSKEKLPPFNDRWYLMKEPAIEQKDSPLDCFKYGKKCFEVRDREYKLGKYISYKDKRTNPAAFDSVKAFIHPYNCTRWEILKDKDLKAIDTLYFIANPHYRNITVDIQTKNSDGSFTTYDWNAFRVYPDCELIGFNGRFPILNETGGPTPLEGTIQYGMGSPFFKATFGIRTLRLRVSIEDRSFHRSNEIFTKEFTLHENN